MKSNDFVLFYGGIFMCLITFYRNYQEKIITEKNNLIKVEIIDLPRDCNNTSKLDRFVRFEYDYKKFTKKININFCKELKNSNYLELYVNDNKDTFVFIDEYDSKSFMYSIVLLVIGILSVFFSTRTFLI